MEYAVFERRVLELAYKTDARITRPLAAFRIECSVEQAQAHLATMVASGILVERIAPNTGSVFDLPHRPPPTGERLSWDTAASATRASHGTPPLQPAVGGWPNPAVTPHGYGGPPAPPHGYGAPPAAPHGYGAPPGVGAAHPAPAHGAPTWPAGVAPASGPIASNSVRFVVAVIAAALLIGGSLSTWWSGSEGDERLQVGLRGFELCQRGECEKHEFDDRSSNGKFTTFVVSGRVAFFGGLATAVALVVAFAAAGARAAASRALGILAGTGALVTLLAALTFLIAKPGDLELDAGAGPVLMLVGAALGAVRGLLLARAESAPPTSLA